jgi:hypothetical protein
MEQYVEHDVQRAFNTVVQALGDTFSFSALINFIELYRNKPLRIEEDAMPVPMTGYCLALQDMDLICTRPGMDDILTRSVQLHEIAHLLLGHLPTLSQGDATLAYAAFRRQRDLGNALWRSLVDAYEAPHERAAETLGTLLLECILRDEIVVPRLARDLYG